MTSLTELATETGISYDDLLLVAQIELIIPDEYDPVEETVTAAGRAQLIQHFNGGVDPT